MEEEDIKDAAYGGLIGGVVFIVLLMATAPILYGVSAWGPPKMIGGIILGREAVMPMAEFDAGVVLTGITIHFILSVFYAIVLGFFVRNLSRAGAAIVGILFGVVLYLINFHLFTELFPWFTESRNWVTILSHLAYGGITGFTYKAFQIKYGHCVNCY